MGVDSTRQLLEMPSLSPAPAISNNKKVLAFKVYQGLMNCGKTIVKHGL